MIENKQLLENFKNISNIKIFHSKTLHIKVITVHKNQYTIVLWRHHKRFLYC